MARGPRMNEERHHSVKAMLQVNDDKGIGWSFAEIGKMCGCSSDTVSRVNRSKDFAEYCEILKAENERRKRGQYREDGKTEVSSEKANTGPGGALTDVMDAIDQMISALGRIRHAVHLMQRGEQITLCHEPIGVLGDTIGRKE